jgi:archaemetzincin
LRLIRATFTLFKARKTKIAILQIGVVQSNVLGRIQEGISHVFPNTECAVLPEVMSPPPEAYNDKRKQYNSSFLLDLIKEFLKKTDSNKILGITSVDLYVPQLTFVFGEAELQGKAAIISLCRLKPEFYDTIIKRSLFLERAVKEAVHEIGHTFGVTHCPNSECVMSFSNTIVDVDRKKGELCQKCSKNLSKLIQ